MLYYPVALCGYILAPVSLGLSGVFWRRRRVRNACLIVAVLFGEATLSLRIEDMIYRRQFHKAFVGVTRRAENLITAIEAYNSAKGFYPNSLDDLVPEFIASIPNTGLAGYPEFKYSVAKPGTLFRTYEILVETPSGGINWDVFVYWPEGGYPDLFYGGVPELIGKWAYVHE
jgi:hypothetical protein